MDQQRGLRFFICQMGTAARNSRVVVRIQHAPSEVPPHAGSAPPFQPASPPSLPLPPPPYTGLWLQRGQAVSLPSSANLDLLQRQQPAPSWKTLRTPRPAAAAAPSPPGSASPAPLSSQGTGSALRLRESALRPETRLAAQHPPRFLSRHWCWVTGGKPGCTGAPV